MTDQRNQPVVPERYAGKWLAWTRDGMRIVGVGATPEEAEAAARDANVTEVIHEWVPPANERIVGSIL